MQENPVLVVDYGAQYAQLIARRVREAKVYSEIVPHTMPVEQILARRPAAIILSGGPTSVYADGAPRTDPALFDAGVPVFGICYGFQAMADALGGTVAHTEQSEFGRTTLDIVESGVLLRGLPDRATGVDEPHRRRHRGAARIRGARVDAGRAHRGVRGHRARAGRGAVPSRGDAQPVRPADPAALPVRHRQGAAHLDRGEHHRRAGRQGACAGRRQAGDLRALRRCRLRGRRRARAARDRLAADLRVRRPRPAAPGRGRAGRARLRRRHRREPQGGARRAAVPRRARRRHRPGGQAQDHRPRVHPQLRGGRPRDRRGRALGRLPRPGHALPGRRRVRRWHGRGEHQEPPQRRRAARGSAVRARRAAAHAVQGRGPPGRRAARPAAPRSCGASRSRAPGSGSASSAR